MQSSKQKTCSSLMQNKSENCLGEISFVEFLNDFQQLQKIMTTEDEETLLMFILSLNSYNNSAIISS